ncbi:MAG: hypothetical protein AAB459_00915 [Patescibacteria group bacterium]
MSHESEHQPKPRSWLATALIGNAGLGAVQVVFGVAGGSNTLLSEGVHNSIDSAGYLMNFHAAGHEKDGNHKKSRQINRIAGWIICSGAAAVSLVAVKDWSHPTNSPSFNEQMFLYSGAALNTGVTAGLHPHSHQGGAHRMGWLHAASDVAGSAINSLGMYLSSRGMANADQIAAIASSAVYIAFNYPTEARITHGH